MVNVEASQSGPQPLEFRSNLLSVGWFRHLLEEGQLNLAPEFQRKSVWSLSDRRKLIGTILEGWPMPAIFLRKRLENGRVCFDVLDGKQRLEAIFMFMGARGFRTQRFDVRWGGDQDGRPLRWDWLAVRKKLGESRIENYQLPVIEVQCDSLATVVDLFVRINSTGKALTGAEKRNARFHRSGLLRVCRNLSSRHRAYLSDNHIISPTQLSRMKDAELMAELIVSMHRGAPSNQKDALDSVLASGTIDGRTLKMLKGQCHAALIALRRLLPGIASTRFAKLSDYYSLVLAVWQLQQDGLVLKGSKPMRAAEKLLLALADRVDAEQQIRRDRPHVASTHELAARYLASVESSSDKAPQRTARHEILCGLLRECFVSKDTRRSFNSNERRLLWNTDRDRHCRGCKVALDWGNFEIDHVEPYASGGRTALANAQLLCRGCNARKGARTLRRRRRRTRA